MLTDASAHSDQIHKSITRLFCARRRARLVGSTTTVGFSCCNTREANVRTLGAPDRTVAIPHMRWSARKGLSGGDDHDSCE
jgi:hypothetical protein